ncbi:tannase and feruloyl esterase [Xylariomycetidae sp. FL2044]|nr:tannase and feruloyl esterase [Xylariomycetidae sp. FL2044]
MQLLLSTLLSLACWASSSLVTKSKPSCSCSTDNVNALLSSEDEAEVLITVHLEQNGTFGQVGDIAYPANATHLPPLCVALVNLTSSPTSSYTFGLFLPDQCNNRFLAVGNGGFLGSINWYDMGTGVKYGFACMSTSTGHDSTGQDRAWALNNPETKRDSAGRSLHGSVVLSKKIIAGYYGAANPKQGIKSAQDHPEDFDQLWQLKIGAINLPEDSPRYILTEAFSTTSDEVLRQCDGSDGLRDGVIMDLRRCNFRPEKLLFTAGRNASACLTAAQVSTLKQLYLPLVEFDADVHSLTYIYPNFGLGSEMQMPSSFGQNNTRSLYGTEYAKYYLFDVLSWDWEASFNYSTFVQAQELNPGIMAVQGVKMDDSYRLFFVPGMQHCSGSVYDALSYFGGNNHAAKLDANGQHEFPVPGLDDNHYDALLALVAWVEQGEAVDRLVTTKFINGTVSRGVLRERPLCKYPRVAVWDGRGDQGLASSWTCEGFD